MNKKQLQSAGLILFILGTAVWIYYCVRPDRIDAGPYSALGMGAEEETAKLLHNTGRVVLVDADFGPYKLLAPTTAAEIKSWKKEMRKTDIKIDAIDHVAIARPSMARNGIFMQPGEFSALLARHPETDAIVLLVGLAGPEDLAGKTPADLKPKIILVSNYEAYDKTFLEKGLIQLAIVSRGPPDADEDRTIHSSKEWFARHYAAVTPDQMAELGD